ncbi:MarR family winged helix-turn-helix transcriptional regulator [Mycetocola zhadangensis]|uniref:MarR family winged helix-turn-helix transcriptional regulator n=1 Tax=Mycetocola zhadangensis TaxID=1164595 RepID=UPI003A4E4ECB
MCRGIGANRKYGGGFPEGIDGGTFQQVRAARLGLGPTDLIALGHRCLAGPLTPSELASRLGLTTGSITSLVDRVQGAGFLVREVNPHRR